MKATDLNQGQKDAATLILNGKDRVIGIQGAAGTAKTTMLNTSRSLAESKGYELIGLAPTKEAANILGQAAGINVQTLHLFLARYDGVLKGRGTKQGKTQMQSDFKNKIIVLDESSLASTQSLNNLLTLSDQLKFRLVLVGDTKQLGAVESGKPFDILQDHGMNTAILRDIKRQQNDGLLKAVYAAAGSVDQNKEMARKGVYSSLKAIGRDNIIDLATKKPSSEELVESTYQSWLKERNKGGKQILVVAPSNQLRKAINSKIRLHYIRGHEIEQQALKSKNLTHAQSQNTVNYTKEDVILFNKENRSLNIKKGSYYKVLEVNQKNRKLLLSMLNQTNDAPIKWDPQKALSSNVKGLLEVYEQEALKIGVGDNIRWTKNSKSNKFIVNGSSASIQDISKSKITFKAGDSTYKLSRNDPAVMHMDHAYCSTVYASQGKTVDTVIGIARSKESVLDLTIQRSFYVTLSRAREKAILVTDNYKGLIRRLSDKTGAKSSAIEHQTLDSRNIEDSVNLKTEGRSVFISKDSNHLKKIKEFESADKQKSYGLSADESYESFINSPNRITEVALHLFGASNNKISKGDNLRFGKKGSVTVNTRSGQWYDFSSGEGGSVYRLAKNNKLLEQKKEHTYKNNPDKEDFTYQSLNNQAKLSAVDKLVKASIPITQETTIASTYLEKHRNICLTDINLSNDIRYTDKAWSSETKSFHSALLSVARDKGGKQTATQAVYLDQKTSDKNKSLEISKRSQGVLKGSFVELTKHKDANTIFIAEGIETALSLAAAKPESRVICSLGVANIKNIDLSQDKNLDTKTIIICADNDGKDSATNTIIERSAYILKEKGAKNIAIIRPDEKGQDFNDVLKLGVKEVIKYIDPLLDKYPNYLKETNSLKDQLHYLNREKTEISRKRALSTVYKESHSVIQKWENLVSEKGIDTARKAIKKNPTILGTVKGFDFFGFKSKSRIEASCKVDLLVGILSDFSENKKAKAICQKQIDGLFSTITNQHLGEISKFATQNLDHKEISFSLEKFVQTSLAAIDKNTDFEQVRFVSTKMTEQIIQYRQRYRKEPTEALKKDYFLRARYEATRLDFMEKHLDKTMPQDTLGNRVLKSQKLERLLSIDSRLAQGDSLNKQQIYYDPPQFKKTLETFKEGESKIVLLTHSFLKQGMDKTKANFIATDIVKYKERTSQHMPLKQQDSLEPIGNYVSNNYKELVQYGFNKDEARISYMEGSKLTLNYKPTARDLEISKGDIKLTQEDVKRTIERHGFDKGGVKSIERSDKQPTIERSRNKSYGKEGMELEL